MNKKLENEFNESETGSTFVDWEFQPERLPDFLSDPLDVVKNFINTLPFAEEDRKMILNNVIDQRSKKTG